MVLSFVDVPRNSVHYCVGGTGKALRVQGSCQVKKKSENFFLAGQHPPTPLSIFLKRVAQVRTKTHRTQHGKMR